MAFWIFWIQSNTFFQSASEHSTIRFPEYSQHDLQPMLSTLYWWNLYVGVTDLPDLAVAHKLVSPTSCLNCCTQCLTVLTSTHYSPYTACMRWWMSMGGIFSPVKNWIMAHCLNHRSSRPSILTGTESELWIVVGSRLCTVEVSCHVTVELVLSSFLYSIKKYDRSKIFSLSPI
jgi:hypothetical protein